MTDEDIFEQIRLFLPKYLTPQQANDLYSELSKFPENKSFYLNGPELKNELLQGDGWRGFVALNFSSSERKVVSGVVLSNSCDVSLDNPRPLPGNVVFAPLIRLSKYVAQLGKAGKSREQVAAVVESIRKQRVTSIFFFPDAPGVGEDAIAVLDDIHVHPLRDFVGSSPTSLFTLNQVAFYLFLMKLSIHFCRFQEGVRRFDGAA